MKYALLVLLAACFDSHTGTREVASTDCYTCHEPDYKDTSRVATLDRAVPDHLANAATYTTTCADCHVTTTWYSHPEKLFNIASGPHTAVACDTCHRDSTDNGGDARGANTLCSTCHVASEPFGAGTMTTGHSDIAAFSYTTPAAGFTTDNFCLACHPNGREKPHDESLFPSRHGNARNCDSCHDRSKSSDSMGRNADCRRCHAGAHHTDVVSPTGCIARGCHQGGGGGGD